VGELRGEGFGIRHRDGGGWRTGLDYSIVVALLSWDLFDARFGSVFAISMMMVVIMVVLFMIP
jgi:hypothetical protein